MDYSCEARLTFHTETAIRENVLYIKLIIKSGGRAICVIWYSISDPNSSEVGCKIIANITNFISQRIHHVTGEILQLEAMCDISTLPSYLLKTIATGNTKSNMENDVDYYISLTRRLIQNALERKIIRYIKDNHINENVVIRILKTSRDCWIGLSIPSRIEDCVGRLNEWFDRIDITISNKKVFYERRVLFCKLDCS
jgi:hypothetical protein